MLVEAVRQLYNKIMARRHRLAKCLSTTLEQQNKQVDSESNLIFRGLMEKNRMWKET